MTPEPSPVAAYLEQVRAAARSVEWARSQAGRNKIRSEPTAAVHVPRLLAAVEAVLARHQPKTVTVREMCKQHVMMGYPGREATRAQIDACPDCVKREQVECTGCNPECPDGNLWEKCPERVAITRELLGKEETRLMAPEPDPVATELIEELRTALGDREGQLGGSLNPTPDCGHMPRKPPAATELWWCGACLEFHEPEGLPDA